MTNEEKSAHMSENPASEKGAANLFPDTLTRENMDVVSKILLLTFGA
jgi:hypothetical protein